MALTKEGLEKLEKKCFAEIHRLHLLRDQHQGEVLRLTVEMNQLSDWIRLCKATRSTVESDGCK